MVQGGGAKYASGQGQLCIIMHFYAFLCNLEKNEKIKGRICVFTRKTIMQIGKIENSEE